MLNVSRIKLYQYERAGLDIHIFIIESILVDKLWCNLQQISKSEIEGWNNVIDTAFFDRFLKAFPFFNAGGKKTVHHVNNDTCGITA